jgi:hypothetical protein
MKAEEIRNYPNVLTEAAVKEVGGDPKKVPRDVMQMSITMMLLAELTAQIAEANEHLAKIANPLITVNAESLWVNFITEDHRRVVFDKGEVVDVHEGVDPIDNRRLIVVISLRNQRYFRIIGDYGVICAKLGIPVEGQ